MVRSLLVRADDAGVSLSGNNGCLLAFTQGIARSVEVMMPGAWVRDAADRFAAHPGLDVGIHLTLTSEWDRVKWRPLSVAPSLVDEAGFFKPLLVPRQGDNRPSFAQSNWSLDEVEAEFRSQIELGLKLFPKASHVSSHMTRHFADVDGRLGALVASLCQTYALIDDRMGTQVMPRIEGYPKFPRDANARVAAFIDSLDSLTAERSIFVDHPSPLCEETMAMGHYDYGDVGEDRASCLSVLTDQRLRDAIDKAGIRLIGYQDLPPD